MAKPSTPHIRKPYDPPMPVSVSFTEPTMAKQSFKDECDINQIMKRYEATGTIEHQIDLEAAYGDFTGVEDYHSAINRVLAAEEAFMGLPARIRRRFSNDPAELLAFVSDEANQDEARSLGLIPSKPSDIAAEGGQSKPAEPLKADPASPDNPSTKTADSEE